MSPQAMGWTEALGLFRRCGFRPWALMTPVLLGLLSSACEAATLALLLPFTRGVLGGRFHEDGRSFFVLGGLIFAASALKSALDYAAKISSAYAAGRFGDRTRQAIFERYLQFGKLAFDRASAAQLQAVLMRGSGELSRQVSRVQGAIASSFLLAAYLGGMFLISWKLTLLVLLAFPVLHWSLDWAIQSLKSSSSAHAESRAALNLRLANVLSCIQLVKAYTMEEEERRRFGQASGQFGALEFQMARLSGLVGPVQEFVSLLAVVLLALGAALLVKERGQAMIPLVLVYFFILRRAIGGFGQWNKQRAGFSALQGSLAELGQLFDDAGKSLELDGARPFEGLQGEIRLQRLSYSFPGLPVLEDASFTIEKGKTTAVVGPSGAGKSTLINLLMRFYDPPPGSILVDGADLRGLTLRSWRGRIALVGQDLSLLNDTIRANVAYGREEASDEQVRAALESARLGGLLERLPDGLSTRIGERGLRLSGGERQRLSIARAMLKQAEILILDEATSSLDSETERLVQEALEALISGKTALVIAHRLSTIKNADRIVFLEEGRVAEQGSLQELLRLKGRFNDFWAAQALVAAP